MQENWIVLFDGYCRLCQGSAEFIARRDRQGRFRFATLQSQWGAGHVPDTGQDEQSLILLAPDGTRFAQSAAWIEILRRLPAPWRWLGCLGWVPAGLRDPVYRFIGRRRYRWFGRRTDCGIPSALVRARSPEPPDSGRDSGD